MKIRYIAFWLLEFVFCQAGGLKAQESIAYVIDQKIQYQEIDNFSASDAWRMDFVGKNWPLEKK